MILREHTFIVGVDYSDSAIAALDQTLIFCKALGNARLLAVLVLPGGPTTAPPRAAQAGEQLLGKARENLMTLVQSREERLGGVQGLVAESRVEYGEPAECLLQLAEEVRPYAIAVGTHGRRGVERLLVGSVAEAVVRGAECSVWVVRPPLEELVEPAEGESSYSEGEVLPGPEASEADDPVRTVLSAPHLDGGRVVVHLLDEQTGRRFLCSFEKMGSVSVQPIERRWVTSPSSEERARVGREALAYSRLHRPAFEQLFAELARRRL